MKLCVPSTGKDVNSKVSYHFGKALYFLIIDTDTMEYEAVKNTMQVAGRGSGTGAAQMVLDKGTSAVLAGIIGPNALDALKVAHVEVYAGASPDDTVREAVEKFNKGQYREAETS